MKMNFANDDNEMPDELGYDLHIDFSRFLEEARKHANDLKLHSYEKSIAATTQQSKRSRKNKLFFWKKFAKKEIDHGPERVATTTTATTTKPSNKKNVSVSGPMPQTMCKARVRYGSSASGWLGGWFLGARANETEIPYISLDRQKHDFDVPISLGVSEEARDFGFDKAFGPIYKVT